MFELYWLSYYINNFTDCINIQRNFLTCEVLQILNDVKRLL